MRGDGRRTRELGVGVHSAHSVRHTVRCGTCRHIVGMERSARATAACHGEILLAVLDSPFLVGARNGMLETGGVGGVARDGDVNVFEAHYRNALGDIVRAVNAHRRALAFGVGGFLDDFDFARVIVHLGLHIGEAVDAADDEGRVLAEPVEYDFEGLFADFVCGLRDADCTFRRGERLVTREERKALGFLSQKHCGEVAVPEADRALFRNGAGDAETLQTDAYGFRRVRGVLAAFLYRDGAPDGVCPHRVFERYGLNAFDNRFDVDALFGADGFGVFEGGYAVLFKRLVNLVDSSFVTFESDAHSSLLTRCAGRYTSPRRHICRKCRCSF